MPKLALLAGGLATRMRPSTLTTAKSMLPVADQPFLAHQLRLLVSQGVNDIVICAGHLSKQIEEFAGDGSRWGCTLSYSHDGPEPLGTGGALRRALPLLGCEFFVMYGDSYLTVRFSEVWQAFWQSGKQGLMTVFANQGRWDMSNIVFEDGEIQQYSKKYRGPAMRHIDYGLSCLNADALERRPEGSAFDLADVMTDLLAREELAAFEVRERFYEIGSPEGLLEAEAMLRARQSDRIVPLSGRSA
jgi:NDP-sugar pyrophosphorylase family protein